jgi:acetyl esterase
MDTPEAGRTASVGSGSPAGVTPAVAKILAFLRDRPSDKRPIAELTLAEARSRMRDLWAGYWSALPPRVAVVRDAVVEITARRIPVRIYQPDGASHRPVFFFHGGGFVLGDLDTHDNVARRLALHSGRPVVSVDYRRAPEHPFPAPVDDCVAAVEAIVSGKADVGIAADGFAVSGDSAGASLALGTALRLRDAGGLQPNAVLLIFGCFDPSLKSQSMARFGGGDYALAARDIRWFWQQFVGPDLDNAPAYAAGIKADLRGLPPVFLGIGGCDPLLDENLAMAERFRAAGVERQLSVWPGMIHGCVGMVRDLDAAEHQLAEIGTWLAGHLS